MSRSYDSQEPDLLSSRPSNPNEMVTAEEINYQKQEAEKILLDLQRQQEEISRKKVELDELSRKQREFEDGRRMVLERFNRGLVVLDRQERQLQKEMEQIDYTKNSFRELLDEIDGINPQEWGRDSLTEELTRALAKVDQARVVYDQSHTRLQALRDMTDSPGETVPDWNQENTAAVKEETSTSFGDMVKSGFAYSLPLLVAIFALILVLLSK